MESANPGPAAEVTSRFHNAALAAGIVVVTFGLHALSPVTTSTDSAWTFHVAASILREHNVDLDEYRPIINLQLDYRMREINGHIYSYYPAATPLLVTPVVWLTNLTYPLAHSTDFYTYLAQHAPDTRTAKLEKLIASGMVGIAAAFVFLTARLTLGIWPSLAAALMFSFATSMWSTASRALWQHGPSVLLLAVSLYLMLKAPDRGYYMFLIGALLGYAYLVRPTNSLAVVFFGLYVVLNHRKQWWIYALGVAIFLIPYISYNLLIYRNPFPPYGYQLFERLASPAVFAEALIGTLVSPGRGLFVFTPLFFFSLHDVYLAAKAGRFSPSSIDPYLAAILVGHWIITSLFEDWGGAWSIGPRYFVDVIPFLIYFLVGSLRTWPTANGLFKFCFTAALVFSTLVQLHCATSIYPFMWNGKPKALVQAPERKWDWGDLQFLRGFCRANPLEGRAPACWFEPGD